MRQYVCTDPDCREQDVPKEVPDSLAADAAAGTIVCGACGHPISALEAPS